MSHSAGGSELLTMRDIVMQFGAVKALRGVNFDLLPGEVHGLLGQNGAGKSTLIKVIAGVHRQTEGELRVLGEPRHFASPAESRDAGIAVVHQSLSLVPNLTVAENLLLGIEDVRLGMIRGAALKKRAVALLEHYNLPLRPQQRVGDLSFAYRQLLEIGKALIKDARILILDEPTSSLSKAEEPILFGAIKEATRKGIGVIYVSHRLSEIFDLTDRVTVFRDGLNAGSFKTRETTIHAVVEAIVGEKLARQVSTDGTSMVHRAPVADDAPVQLELRGLTNDVVSGVDLTVRRGEIVGLVGSTGSGRTELLESIFGVRRIKAGVIRSDRTLNINKPEDAIKAGIKLVPEDRHIHGLVLQHDLERNNAMAVIPDLQRLGVLFSAGKSRELASQVRERLSIKAPSIFTKAEVLSGGNQQKIVLGKWLNSDTRVLLLDEPTAGVDIGARAEIYKIIAELADRGTAVLVASSDYEELLQLCSRFVFIRGGRVIRAVPRGHVTDERDLHRILEDDQEGEAHV